MIRREIATYRYMHMKNIWKKYQADEFVITIYTLLQLLQAHF